MSTATDTTIAVASSVAAFAGLGALWYTATTARRQVDNDRRGQASRVIALTTQAATLIEISNRSEHTIYGVMTWVHGTDGSRDVSTDQYRAIPPGRTEVADIGTITDRITQMAPLQGKGAGWRTEVLFTDEAGVRWRREVDGPLHELNWRHTGVIGPGWFRPLPSRVRALLVRSAIVDLKTNPDLPPPYNWIGRRLADRRTRRS